METLRDTLRKYADSVLIAPEGHAIGLMVGTSQVYFERTFKVACVIKHKLAYVEASGYPVKSILDNIEFDKEHNLVKLLKGCV